MSKFDEKEMIVIHKKQTCVDEKMMKKWYVQEQIPSIGDPTWYHKKYKNSSDTYTKINDNEFRIEWECKNGESMIHKKQKGRICKEDGDDNSVWEVSAEICWGIWSPWIKYYIINYDEKNYEWLIASSKYSTGVSRWLYILNDGKQIEEEKLKEIKLEIEVAGWSKSDIGKKMKKMIQDEITSCTSEVGKTQINNDGNETTLFSTDEHKNPSIVSSKVEILQDKDCGNNLKIWEQEKNQQKLQVNDVNTNKEVGKTQINNDGNETTLFSTDEHKNPSIVLSKVEILQDKDCGNKQEKIQQKLQVNDVNTNKKVGKTQINNDGNETTLFSTDENTCTQEKEIMNPIVDETTKTNVSVTDEITSPHTTDVTIPIVAKKINVKGCVKDQKLHNPEKMSQKEATCCNEEVEKEKKQTDTNIIPNIEKKSNVLVFPIDTGISDTDDKKIVKITGVSEKSISKTYFDEKNLKFV